MEAETKEGEGDSTCNELRRDSRLFLMPHFFSPTTIVGSVRKVNVTTFLPPKATCYGVLRCNTLDITEVQEEEFYFFFPEEQQMFLSSSPPPNVQIKCQRILSISIKFHPSSSYLVLVDPVFNHPRNAGFTWFSFVAF